MLQRFDFLGPEPGEGSETSSQRARREHDFTIGGVGITLPRSRGDLQRIQTRVQERLQEGQQLLPRDLDEARAMAGAAASAAGERLQQAPGDIQYLADRLSTARSRFFVD